MRQQQGVEQAQDIRTERQAESTSAAIQASSFQQILEGRAVVVRKNSTGTEITRPRLNLIEGANIGITIADDPPDNEADITLSLPTSPDVSGVYKVDGSQVVSERKTGWGAPIGILSRAAFEGIDAAQLPISAAYTQAEIEAMRDVVVLLTKTLAALLTDVHANTSGHGLLGT